MSRLFKSTLLLAGLVISFQSQAVLIDGTSIISAPTSVGDTRNSAPQGFNEITGFSLLDDLAVDGGFIAAGTRVDSQMIFLNPSRGNTINFNGARFLFDGIILGVMSDIALVDISNSFLGNPGTSYAGANSGMEPGTRLFPFGIEGYTTSGNRLSLSLTGNDFIRVITASNSVIPPPVPVPEPSGLALFVAGLLGIRRLKRLKLARKPGA